MADATTNSEALLSRKLDNELSLANEANAEIFKLKEMEKLSISEENKSSAMPDGPEPDVTDNKDVTFGDTPYTSSVTFEDLNLSKELIEGLYVEMGFSRPSKIQATTLPMILTPPYKDLVAQAQNGSGKTTCFVLGMLSRVDPTRKAPQSFCICPTRELAQQNHAVLMKMGKHIGITTMLCIQSGSSRSAQILKCSPVTDHVVIGTPGTINKWISGKKLSTRDVKILVFDEADHMFAEESFKHDSEHIIRKIRSSSSGCQVLLFSATYNETVKEFVLKMIKDANKIFMKKEDLTLENVKQYKVQIPDELAKIEVIKDKIFEFGEKVGQTIIFVRTRESARILHKTLTDDGYECTAVEGSLDKDARDIIIKEFRDGLTRVLITTDMLARGFNQREVNLVINYDLPVRYGYPAEPDYETYLHRVGRTGRFGSKGAVFNFVCTDTDREVMEKIELHFQSHVTEVPNWRDESDFESALKEAGLM